jgi:hypothetical protein
MVKITITIEGDQQEVTNTWQKLLKPGVVGQLQEEEEAEAEVELVKLTPDELRQLWNKISLEARHVLAEIARKPNGYSFETLQKTLNLSSGLAIAGRLSSVGHRMRDFKGKASPVRKDLRERLYRMDSDIATIILELASPHKNGE